MITGYNIKIEFVEEHCIALTPFPHLLDFTSATYQAKKIIKEGYDYKSTGGDIIYIPPSQIRRVRLIEVRKEG